MRLGKYNSRKVIAGLVIFLAGTAVELYKPTGLSQYYTVFLLGLLGIYVTGNIGSKKYEAEQSKSDEIRAFNSQVTAVSDAMIQLEGNQKALEGAVGQINDALTKVVRR